MEGRYNQLTTYGIMKEYVRKDILDWINKLAADNFLSLTNDGYPVLKLTKKALAVLSGEESVNYFFDFKGIELSVRNKDKRTKDFFLKISDIL